MSAQDMFSASTAPKIESLQDFQDELQKAFARGFRGSQIPCDKVTVQFFHFKDRDLEVDKAEKELGQAFKNVYGYDVRFYEIGSNPKAGARMEVNKVLFDLHMSRGGERCLLILVFSGHGDVEVIAGKKTLWVGGALDPSGRIMEPKLEWVATTNVLNTTASDVLHIVDCCCAAEAVSTLGAEVLAATSGTEATSADPGKSFTKAITKQLVAFNGRETTAVGLYGDLFRSKDFYNLEYSPFYYPHHRKPSIILKRLSASPTTPSKGKSRASNTRVIVTAHIREDLKRERLEDLKKWLLTHVPADVTGVDVRCQGVFKTESTLLILSMPVELWALLKSNPAIAFVAVVKSDNLLLKTAGSQPAPLAIRGGENTRPGGGSGLK